MINIFSFFIIGYFLYNVLFYRNIKKIYANLFVFSIFCTLNIKMGYFLKLNDSYLMYQSVLIYFLAIISILILMRKGIKNIHRYKSFFLFLLALFIGVVLLVLIPYNKIIYSSDWNGYVLGHATYQTIGINSLHIGYYLMFFCTGCCLLAARTIFDVNDWKHVLNKIVNLSKISIIVGWTEFFVVNVFNSRAITDLFIYIFGLYGAQQNSLNIRGLFYLVQGMTKEASMFTTSIFYICILITLKIMIMPNSKKRQQEFVWLICGVLLLCVNPALSAIVYLCILFLLWYLRGVFKFKTRNINNQIKIFMCTFAVLLIAFLVITNYEIMITSSNYIINRIGLSLKTLMSIFGDMNQYSYYSSESIRFAGMNYDLKLLMERPLFGYGLGSFSCNSGIVTFLSNAGIIAFVLWCIFMLKIASLNIKSYNIETLTFVFVLPNLFLNDYETILCMVIPLIIVLYDYVRLMET